MRSHLKTASLHRVQNVVVLQASGLRASEGFGGGRGGGAGAECMRGGGQWAKRASEGV